MAEDQDKELEDGVVDEGRDTDVTEVGGDGAPAQSPSATAQDVREDTDTAADETAADADSDDSDVKGDDVTAAKDDAAEEKGETEAKDEKPAAKKKAPAKKAATKAKKDEAEEKDEKPKKAAAKKETAKKPAAKKDEKAEKKPAAKEKAEAEKPAAKPEKVFVRASAKYVRVAPRKARLVADQVRGKHIDEARALLAFSPRHAALDIKKLIESAAANAENNHDLIADDMRVAEIRVDEGPIIKRFRPRAQGRATRINKRTSHISVALSPEE